MSTIKLSTLIRKMHSAIESKENGNRISQEEMAKRLGISLRTYAEYRKDTNQPLAMKALLNILSQLEDEDVLKMIRLWKGKDK